MGEDDAKPIPPDQEPGFWCEWSPPSPMAEAIQYPLHDPAWQGRVLNAYVRRQKRPQPERPTP